MQTKRKVKAKDKAKNKQELLEKNANNQLQSIIVRPEKVIEITNKYVIGYEFYIDEDCFTNFKPYDEAINIFKKVKCVIQSEDSNLVHLCLENRDYNKIPW